jgi:HAMP domain-containing protein
MTSPSKYTIQLLEGIHDDTQRHDLANEAARLLGTNAEQLEQLLARGIGARIARAGSEKRAEHVAGLLRSVGVQVEVVAPQEEGNEAISETESPATSFEGSFVHPSSEAPASASPAVESPALESPAVAASFENTSSELMHTDFDAAASQPGSDEAGSTWWLPNGAQAPNEARDAFAADQSDPFASAGDSDPFASAGDSDPFASAGDSDPFASVIGAQTTTDEETASTLSQGNDPFSTLLPSDDSSANWSVPNDQVSAPWLNSSALSSNAGTVPFEPVNPFGNTAGSDPFAAASGNDPFASAITEQYPPVPYQPAQFPQAQFPQAQGGSSDPFGTNSDSDQFVTASSNDPFGPAVGSDSFDNDPFAAPNSSDPFGPASGSDPFAMNADPFGPASSTTTIIRNDPFAAPLGTARDPFAPVSDPFAAPTGDLAPAISLTSTSELPPQARAARDRAPRRSSIQTKTIVALIVPIILVVAGIVGFLSYQLPTTITTLLKARATAIAAVTAESLRPNFDRGDVSQANVDSLSGLATGSLQKVPYGAFFMIEHEARDIRQIDTEEGLASADVVKYFKDRQKALDDGTDTVLGKSAEIVNIGGTNYIAAAAPFTSTNMMGHGKAWVFTGLKMDPINESLRNTLIPIFVAIGITLLLALAIGTGLARSLLRPIIAATQQANRISLGDLDRTVPNSGNDEIADLLTALEQMRISLKSMVTRLRRDRA